MAMFQLFSEAVEDVDELGEALSACGIPFGDGVGDALFDVKAEDGEADAIERGLGGGELLEDLDAEPRLLDHAADAAHLPFDPVESRDDSLLLRLVQHAGHYTQLT